MYLTDLTNTEWQNIKENVNFKILSRKRKHSVRQIINAIFYVTKTGIQWRMMPNDFPKWQLVYYYFKKWAKDGTTEKIHNAMALNVRLSKKKQPSPSLGLVDSQTVKTMSVTNFKGIDGNKKVNGRKRFILTDTLGLIMALVITTGNTGERAGAELLLEKINNRFNRLVKVLADQGFDGVEFINKIQTKFSLIWQVVTQVLGLNGFVVVPKRWIVERTFGWFAFHRRLTKDYEVIISHSESFIYWSMIRIMAKQIRGT